MWVISSPIVVFQSRCRMHHLTLFMFKIAVKTEIRPSETEIPEKEMLQIKINVHKQFQNT